ncbi:MAG: hypothetical protein NTY77_09630 [Elusimicrobia bacterium]|nr:hypothetical protein [Elusimicrobiota bacterium]
MGILVILASIFSFASAPAFCAQPKSPSASSPFKLKFVGEGGGYNQLPPDASDAMETGAQQSGASGATAQPVPRPLPHHDLVPVPDGRPSEPLPIHPALTRPRPAVTRPRTDAAGTESSAPADGDRRRYSLWEGLAAPMELSAQKINGVSEDQAATLGRRDYESHILGQKDAGAPPAQLRAQGAVAAGPAVAGRTDILTAGKAPEVFVTLNIDLKKHPDATLKDAVADLSRLAGFRQDPRFEPAAVGAGPDQISLWGWLPSNRVGAALQVPTVARLQINPAARQPAPQTATDMLMGVRVPPGRSLAEVVADLERNPATPGLRVRRTIGTQTVPGTAETVLVVEASVPISVLPRVMALRDVVKMMPAPPAPPAPQHPKRRVAGELRGFLAFVAGQYPMLLVLTLLMLLPWVGSRVAAAVRVFVPYR